MDEKPTTGVGAGPATSHAARAAAGAVLVFVVVTAIAVFHTPGGTGGSALPGTPTPASPAATATPATAAPAAGSPDQAAQAFFTSYVAYLYGQAPIESVVNVSPSTRPGLAATLAGISAAERGRRHDIVSVRAVPAERDNVTGIGVISEAGVPFKVAWSMSLYNGTWLTDSVPVLGTS